MKKKSNYPASYFTNPDVIEKANIWGLTDIENDDLTDAGLIAKMYEWQDDCGGVEEYVYDLTAEVLGDKMPKDIIRGEKE